MEKKIKVLQLPWFLTSRDILRAADKELSAGRVVLELSGVCLSSAWKDRSELKWVV